MRSLVLIGGGDHARVVLDAARSRPDEWTIAGFIDAQERAEMVDDGVPWLGDDHQGLARPDAGGCWYIISIGGIADTTARRRVAAAYQGHPLHWASVVHNRAVVSASASIGHGVAIMAGAVINPGAVLGDHCIINTGAIIEHDVRIGALANVSPGVVIGGGATIGAGAYVGLGSRVRDHVRVGEGAVVGMGSVVVADVADRATVTGVPARPFHP